MFIVEICVQISRMGGVCVNIYLVFDKSRPECFLSIRLRPLHQPAPLQEKTYMWYKLKSSKLVVKVKSFFICFFDKSHRQSFYRSGGRKRLILNKRNETII